MATPDNTYLVNIYPYPLVNLSAVSSLSRTYTIEDKGSYYKISVNPDEEITVSADGYLSQTKTIVSDTDITLIPTSLEVSKLSNSIDTYTIRDDVAREAIGNLATVATSGSYNDLSNKPTIPTVDQTYSSSSTSTNALSHKAIADSKFIQNTASSNLSTTVGGIATTSLAALNVGNGSSVSANYGTAVGVSAAVVVLAEYGVALGQGAVASKTYAIQLGHGTNSEANSFYVGLSDSNNYKLLSSDGTIPNTRLNVMTGADGTNAGTKGVVPAPTATDNTKFLRGDGTWAAVSGGGSDVEEYSIAEIEALWDGESE